MIVFPATGFLVMALEAVKQMCPPNRTLVGLYVREAHFLSAMPVKETLEESTETMVQLYPVRNVYEKEPAWFDVKIFAYSNGQWAECFRGCLKIHYEENAQYSGHSMERRFKDARIFQKFQLAQQSCTRPVDRYRFYEYFSVRGFVYGNTFQLANEILWDGDNVAIARVDLSGGKHQMESLVHPAILDAAFQVLLTQSSGGTFRSTPMHIPYQIFDAWFSASGWQQSSSSCLRFLTEARQSKDLTGTIHIIADDMSPLCSIENLIMKPISDGVKNEGGSKKLLYGINWNPQLSLLDHQQLHDTCNNRHSTKDESSMKQYRMKLDHALDMVVRKTYRQFSGADRSTVPNSLQRYMLWMAHYVTTAPAVDEISAESLQALLQEVEELRPSLVLFPVIARNLKSILHGETDPLQLGFDTGLAESVYDDTFGAACDDRLQRLLELICHETPGIKVLEIGAGTGGFTSRILSVFQGLEACTSAHTFAEYDYTDISPAFFENGRKRLASFGDRIFFKTLDLERDPGQQGFELGRYDLVVAGSVLHATTDLAKAIRNVRSLLKPAGHLLNMEITVAENLATNFAFGTFPGWWSSKEEWRSLSPLVDEPQWDRLLRDNGFSGNDIILRDYQSDTCHVCSLMLSTAEDSHPVAAQSQVCRLILNPCSTLQRDLVQTLQTMFPQLSESYRVDVVSLDQLQQLQLADTDIIIFLAELDEPLLANHSEKSFLNMQNLITHTRNLLWVTLADPSDSKYPYYGCMQGFLRSIRSEAHEKKIISLGIESATDDAGICANFILKVFKASFEFNCSELEYVVRDGQLMTGRLIEEVSMNQVHRDRIIPHMKTESWMPGPPVKLEVKNRGMLDSLHFGEDTVYQAELHPEDVEIEVKAWAVRFRDVLIALGRVDGGEIGSDCAGVVTRVGADCQQVVKPGDRVFMGSMGGVGTYARSHITSVYKLTDGLSFEIAASVVSPAITAYYSLLNIGRLERHEKVLIHSASGSTGQMAIWIARMIGAEIFVTVGFDEKKQLLIDNFGIPEDHILYSRNTSFAEGVMRLTGGTGVDVVLNSLSGDGLRASWDCMAPYGRFIEIGRADIDGNSALPMKNFAKNISFAAVDLHHLAETKPTILQNLTNAAMELFNQGTILPPSPLNMYPISKVEQAFRHMQSGKSMGRIVITVDQADIVTVSARPLWSFFLTTVFLVRTNALD